MQKKLVHRTSGQARHEIATATVGFLIALAFAAMVEAVKDSVKVNLLIPQAGHLPVNSKELWETGLIATTFWLAGFSFFLGTQTYLWSPSVQNAPTKGWLYDFVATLVTLTILVFMGATSAFESKFVFVDALLLLFGFQTAWGWFHVVYAAGKHIITHGPFKREAMGFWDIVNPLILSLTFWVYHSDRHLGRSTLIKLLLIQLVAFLWDIVAALKAWERKEAE